MNLKESGIGQWIEYLKGSLKKRRDEIHKLTRAQSDLLFELHRSVDADVIARRRALRVRSLRICNTEKNIDGRVQWQNGIQRVQGDFRLRQIVRLDSQKDRDEHENDKLGTGGEPSGEGDEFRTDSGQTGRNRSDLLSLVLKKSIYMSI